MLDMIVSYDAIIWPSNEALHISEIDSFSYQSMISRWDLASEILKRDLPR